MQWINTVATLLHVTNIDVYIIGYALVIIGIFIAMGINRIFDCFFWLVAGIAIFIVLQVLFFGYSSDMNSGAIINPATAKFIVGSSIYLIFILSILTPINGILQLSSGSKNRVLNILETLFLSLFLGSFYTTVIIWLAEKAYIFRLDSAFSLLKNVWFWANMSSTSIIYGFLHKNVTWIVIAGMGYIFYKLIFGDLLSSMFEAIVKAMAKKWWWGGGGWDKGWGWGGGWEKKK